jgi:hypothetical protein
MPDKKTNIYLVLLSLMFIAPSFGFYLYSNLEKIAPKSFVMKVKPETMFYIQQKHQTMYKDLVKAVNTFQKGDKSEAVRLAKVIYDEGLIYFGNRAPDFENPKDRLIADRMLATSSWLAGWTVYDARTSEQYAENAYKYSLGLKGPADFWTINHLYDIGSRRLEQNNYQGANAAFDRIIKTYREHPKEDFKETERIAMAYVYAAHYALIQRDLNKAQRLANEALPFAHKSAKEDLLKILETTTSSNSPL